MQKPLKKKDCRRKWDFSVESFSFLHPHRVIQMISPTRLDGAALRASAPINKVKEERARILDLLHLYFFMKEGLIDVIYSNLVARYAEEFLQNPIGQAPEIFEESHEKIEERRCKKRNYVRQEEQRLEIQRD